MVEEIILLKYLNIFIVMIVLGNHQLFVKSGNLMELLIASNFLLQIFINILYVKNSKYFLFIKIEHFTCSLFHLYRIT